MAIANGLPIDYASGTPPRRDRLRLAFTQAERDYLDSLALGRLATVGASGRPDVAVARYAFADDEVRISSMDMSKTIKFHNLKSVPDGVVRGRRHDQ